MTRRACIAAVVASLTLGACSRDPAKASRRYIESGDRYAQQGKYTEAAIEYRNAIKQTPQSAEAHGKLADVAARANDPATAIGELLRVAELKPDDVAARDGLKKAQAGPNTPDPEVVKKQEFDRLAGQARAAKRGPCVHGRGGSASCD